MKVLMVCLGNICRSPLAEGILKSKAANEQPAWFIDSAGTGNYHIGEPPHKLSQKVALANGIDISRERCRQFIARDMEKFDMIYVMDSDNYNDVRHICRHNFHAQKVDLIMNAIYPGENRQVPDPWYGGEDGFQKVFDMLDKACDAIMLRFKGESSKIKTEELL